MIGFIIGAVAGCFVGITATVINYAANDRTASACAEAYERGRKDGWKQTCMCKECGAECATRCFKSKERHDRVR